MAEFLLEFFCEEIPARMQARAAADLAVFFEKRLQEKGLKHGPVQSFVTPRRLGLSIQDLPEKSADINEEKRGPRVDAPQQAIDGFLKANGITLDQCEKRGTDKGDFYFYTLKAKGEKTAHLLPDLIQEAINAFPWPKSMKHGHDEQRWVRPLHSVLAVFNGKKLTGKISLNGRDIAFTSKTRGHRFVAPQAIEVTCLKDYKAGLKKAKVLVDREERKTRITEQITTLAKSRNLTVIPDPALLEEVTGLVEWPVALMGQIDKEFMDLPQEVLTTTMRSHQKYFSLQDKKGMAPYFITIANIETKDKGKAIITGNERVLRARLSDAKFFWEQDKVVPLADNLPRLDAIIFHDKIGTLAERVDRIKTHAVLLSEHIEGADSLQCSMAALLCKADLVTHMVYEFPELQGIMGGYYAQIQGETPAVCAAIRDHYAPQGPSDDCPSAPVSIAVALAEKLDTLIALFSVGEKPTGSKDPYALRRAALGVIRLILENHVRVPLLKFIPKAVAPDLMSFFADRLKVYLKDQGIRHDYIAAVFADGAEDDLYRLVEKVKAVQAFADTDDGTNLLAAYKRAANIIKAESKKDGGEYDGEIKVDAFIEDQEKRLFETLEQSRDACQTHLGKEDYEAGMAAMAKIRPVVDTFFDAVMVNVDDKQVRKNRLNLLARIQSTMNNVADFSKIEG